jgi:hypothetical protein
LINRQKVIMTANEFYQKYTKKPIFMCVTAKNNL